MTDQEIAQAAAKRWGQTNPAPADVIDRHIPHYDRGRTHARRWHRIASMTYSLVLTPEHCEYCESILYGKTQGKRQYCDASCCAKADRERSQREARRSA